MDKKLDSALGCFEVSNLTLGYKVLDAITRENHLRILEASAVSSQAFLILIEASAEKLKMVDHRIAEVVSVYGKEGLRDCEILPKVSQHLLPAYYSLLQQKLEESLLVLETETISGALFLANHLLEKDRLKIIELKVMRGSQGKCLAFFTGSREACDAGDQDIAALLKRTVRAGTVEVIHDPKPAFREFFNLSGRA
jgi:hypothetical protein